jgi:NADH-quinone oxidoreductase subunit G
MESITLTINGQRIQSSPGKTILQIAQDNGFDIPTLCHHPKLSIVGACRLCLVEVENARGLMAACSTPAVHGMVIQTHSHKSVESRKSVLELLLSDHPLECMTCEAGGKCKLQNYAYEYNIKTMKYRAKERDFEMDSKNPFYIRDMRLCISCGLCVRVCDEVVGASALGFSNRGNETYVGPAFGKTIDESTCVSCGSCVQLCPTGALTTKHARNRRRTANINMVKTTCTYCGVGCQMNLMVDKNEVIGVEPAEGPSNDGFLCVKGKFGFNFINHPDRLKTPLIRENGHLVEATWEEALDLIEQKLKSAKEQYGPDSIAGLSSARCTNEENYLMQKMFRAVIGTNNIDHCARL